MQYRKEDALLLAKCKALANVEPKQIGVDKKLYLKPERDAHFLKAKKNSSNVDTDSCLSISPGRESETEGWSDYEVDPSSSESIAEEQPPFAPVRRVLLSNNRRGFNFIGCSVLEEDCGEAGSTA